MRNTRKFTSYVNWGALALLIAAMVALLCTQRIPKSENRAPASVSGTASPSPASP